MNEKNFALTAVIGILLLLCLLLGGLLFLQSQSTTALTIDEVKSTLTQELSPLKKNIEHLDEQVTDLKAENDNDLQKSLDELRTAVAALENSSMATSKVAADLAAGSASGNDLSTFFGNVNSDPKLKSEFADVVKSVAPQKKWVRLWVKNDFTGSVFASPRIPFTIVIESPNGPKLAEELDAISKIQFVGTVQVGTKIFSEGSPTVPAHVVGPEFDNVRLRVSHSGAILPEL